MERLLAAHDPPLTLTGYLALRAAAEPGLTGGELARRTGVSEPAVSQLLRGLERQGLLRRRPGEEDRRRQAVDLTETGERAVASAADLLGERLADLLGRLGPREAETLAALLGAAEAALAGTAPPRRPPPPRPPRPASLPGPRARTPRRRP